MSTAPFDPVLLKLVRRAMPSIIAHQITGVSPMTAPTGGIFSMRARYGDSSPLGCCGSARLPCVESADFAADMLWVDLPIADSALQASDIMLWAVQTMKGSFFHRHHVEVRLDTPIEEEMVPVHRWYFANENDAFLFKMRWVGAPVP